MADHKMPAGIKRVEKGVYRTSDDKEIRQDAEAGTWITVNVETGAP